MKWKKLVSIALVVFKFVPKPVMNFLWFVSINSENKISLLIRYIYLHKYAYKIGDNVFVGKFSTFKNIQYLTIGDNVSLHAYTYIDAYGGVEIGNNVSIANHCSIISFDHTWSDKNTPIKYNKVIKKPILIHDDVWIGCGVRVLGNSKILERTIVAAGAIVNKELEPNSIFAGVPAKKLKEI